MPALTAAAVLLLLAAGAASLGAGEQLNRKRLPPALSARHAALTPPDTPEHSVSGFSSGADAAIIHQLAFSQRVVGAGIQAGAPYGCQILPDCGNTCSGKNYTRELANRVRPLVLLPFMRACCLLTSHTPDVPPAAAAVRHEPQQARPDRRPGPPYWPARVRVLRQAGQHRVDGGDDRAERSAGVARR